MAHLSEELAEVWDTGDGGCETAIELIAVHLPVVLLRHQFAQHVETPVVRVSKW